LTHCKRDSSGRARGADLAVVQAQPGLAPATIGRKLKLRADQFERLQDEAIDCPALPDNGSAVRGGGVGVSQGVRLRSVLLRFAISLHVHHLVHTNDQIAKRTIAPIDCPMTNISIDRLMDRHLVSRSAS
jgi:hypothetical protein